MLLSIAVFIQGSKPPISRFLTEGDKLGVCFGPGDASVSSLFLAVVVLACCCVSKLRTVATFKLKAPAKNPVLNSSGVQCKTLILKTTSLSLFTAQLELHVTSHVYAQRRVLDKEEYYASVLER